jgi:hypothetical protein
MINRSTLVCVMMLIGEVACAPVTTRVPVTTPVAGTHSAAPKELTCGSLGPSTDPDAIARVGALFSRPDNVEFRHVSSHYSEVYALSVSAHLVLRVNTVPGFTVAATRDVFGENTGGLDLGYINDEFGRSDPVVIKHKGVLDYEEEFREKSPDSKISRNVFSFVIGQNPNQTALEAAQLNDSDRVENVEILQRG